MEKTLICLAIALVVGLLMSRLAKLVHLPAVTAYLVGGLLIGIVESLYTGVGPSVYRDVVAFVLLIGFLLVKPEGILKKKTVNR